MGTKLARGPDDGQNAKGESCSSDLSCRNAGQPGSLLANRRARAPTRILPVKHLRRTRLESGKRIAGYSRYANEARRRAASGARAALSIRPALARCPGRRTIRREIESGRDDRFESRALGRGGARARSCRIARAAQQANRRRATIDPLCSGSSVRLQAASSCGQSAGT